MDKYNEELDGIRKKSFKLGKQGEYDTSDSNLIARLNEEHKSRAVKLDILNEIKIANDYFTPQELVSRIFSIIFLFKTLVTILKTRTHEYYC